MRLTQSLPPDYFERMFASDPDPWQFATSPYETEKYRASMAALGHGRYRLGLEVGCANGVLTSQLAPRCDALISIDVSGTALAHARQQRRSVAGHLRPDDIPQRDAGRAFRPNRAV